MFFIFQAGGNDGYLLNLASRYSEDLGISYLDVLQQLEDLRLAGKDLRAEIANSFDASNPFD